MTAAAGAAPPRLAWNRRADEVAPLLLGRVVEHRSPAGLVAVRLTEVEAYLGPGDPGSHARAGLTPRTAVMFGPPARLYVYFSYGMHWCVNLVCSPDGEASAVLLRAGEVVRGHEPGPSPASRGEARPRPGARSGPARPGAGRRQGAGRRRAR
ncbi:hypothetical protein GCM10025868_06120 [Angustibacter aerolatus]|uniref:Putative 3-methyladenine DNA glycosylase n=1 Tax=Angustibacter aerolatus TaxID=1162965 RepID=A0ABQ6JB02_9ACTN|nr:DNA-3-methyladenine glycosylase [Angustibacter aerolatus]GMA85362.1 hypothetical protein GCM10025868_06120 [Angustibacter aerolatus]